MTIKTHHTLYFGWAYHIHRDGKVVHGDMGYGSEAAARAAGGRYVQESE